MPTLITDIGGTTSNSYVSLQEANDYFDSRPRKWSELWNGLTMNAGDENTPNIVSDDDEKARYLIQAVRNLESTFLFDGWQVRPAGFNISDPQKLAFPRWGIYDRNGFYYSQSDRKIPDEMKEAQCEQAYALLLADRMNNIDPSTVNLKKGRVGDLDAEFKDIQDGIKIVPDYVRNIISHLLDIDKEAKSFIVRRG